MVRERIILILQPIGLIEDVCLKERNDYFNVLTNKNNVKVVIIE